MLLDGEIAIVTGAGRGIGEATARALAAAGARVVVAARKAADAERVAAALPSRRAVAIACDVATPAAIDAMVVETRRRFGPPSVLINNAGLIAPIGLLHTLDPDALAAGIQVTLTGAMLAARAVLASMLEIGRGTIINLSSGAAHRPLEGWSPYCAAKAGLAMLTRSIALEYGARGIRVFGLAPGLVDTAMQGEIRASGINPVSRLPREALSPAGEPAAAITFLCSAAAGAFVGQEIDIREASFRAASGLPPLAA